MSNHRIPIRQKVFTREPQGNRKHGIPKHSARQDDPCNEVPTGNRGKGGFKKPSASGRGS